MDYTSGSEGISNTSKSKKPRPKKSNRGSRETPRAANLEERPMADNFATGRLRSGTSEERLRAANPRERRRAANPRGTPRTTKSRGRPGVVNSGERSKTAGNSRRSSVSRSGSSVSSGETPLPGSVAQGNPEILGVQFVHGVRHICVKWKDQRRKNYLTEEQLTEELRTHVKNYLQKELEEFQTSLSLPSRRIPILKYELRHISIKEFRTNQDMCFADTTFFKNVGLDNVEKKFAM